MISRPDIDIINQQHENISLTLQKLRNNTITDTQTLSDLLLYITEHFDTEEKLCIKYDFDKTKLMQDLHLNFIKSLNQIIKENNNNIQDYLNLLNNWLNKHITSIDQELIDHVLDFNKGILK